MEKRKLANIIIQTVFLAILLVFVGLVVRDAVLIDRPEQLSHVRFSLTDWEWVHPDGTREQITLPTNLKTATGEEVIIETKAFRNIEEGFFLMFYNARDVRIYVGDELRYEFIGADALSKRRVVKGIWSFTELKPEDCGKTIRIVRTSTSTSNGIFKELYCGDGLGLCYGYVKEHAIFYFSVCVLAVLAVMLMISGSIVNKVTGHKIALVKLGVGMMLSALWLVFDSEVFQLVFDDYYLDGMLSYLLVTMIPVPLFQYIDQMQKYRLTRWHKAMEAFSLSVALVLAILHYTGISRYDRCQSIIMAAYGLMTVGALATIIVDIRKGNLNRYRFLAIGTVGFLVSALIELILLMSIDDRNDGAVLLVGFYIILLAGVVQQVNETYEADRAGRQAQEANRQKSNFLANMSHEIRTPINSIIGMNEMILRENTDPKVREYAMQVASSGRLLLGLINDVLDFSKIEAGKLEVVNAPFDIGVVINDIEVIMRERTSAKNLKSVFEISDDIPSEVLGDEIHFKQILINLLSNAVKYTEEGSVTLSISSSPAVTDKTIDLKVAVADTGIGIRQENLDVLFDTFTRVDRNRNSSIEGTGLGLSIVKSLVTAMDGTISVESTYGRGSTFTVSLPFEVIDVTPVGNLHDMGRMQSDAETMYHEKFHAPKASILAVDDNLVNLKVVCELLKTTEMSIDTASGGRECLDKCRDKHYNLILMDHRMPDPDGIETLHMLREQVNGLNADTPVIVLTANAISGLREKYVAEGFVDYISKPIDSKLLEGKIMKYLPPELIEPDDTNQPDTAGRPDKADQPGMGGLSPEQRMRRVEGMDYDVAVNAYGGSEEFMRTLLATIVSEGRSKISEMRTAVESKDYKNYRVLVHAVKSDMATIGATVLSDRARTHEFASRDGDYEFILKDFDDFIDAYQDMIDRIDRAL